jgi:acyl carrier protein
MDRQHIEAVIMAVLAAVLKCEVNPDISRENTPQWDSLKHIEVIFAVEDELGLQFSEEELASLDSVAKIVDLALSRHAT